MKVEKLTLKNFRNVQNSSLYPDEAVNFLIGSNGQGKTSFLEALGFLANLRSFRDSKLAQVIQRGTQQSELSCTLSADHSESGNWKTGLRLVFQLLDQAHQKASKTAFINEKAFRSSTQYLSQKFGSFELGFHTIIFNPSDHDLVRGDPSCRRNYLDQVIAAQDFQYLTALQKYHRVLQQRNAVLKSHKDPCKSLLEEFTDQLCRIGIELTQKRLKWICRLTPVLQEAIARIAPRQPELRLLYFSTWVPPSKSLSLNNKDLNSVHFAGQGTPPSLELLEQSFWEKALALEAAEWRLGHSLVGPHRDDWTFFLDGQLLKGHGSQGEIRSALLALKLSEIELFRKETGHRPLFLLDDFSSELDQERRLFLLQFLMKTDLQTFVTTTEDLSFMGKRFYISNGLIEEGKND